MKRFISKITGLIFFVSIILITIQILVQKKWAFYATLNDSDTPLYFNPSHTESIIDFKLSKKKHHEISIIGTSRTAGFERQMFRNKKTYNYSMIINSLIDIFSLTKDLDLQHSDTLILGLDQWDFNKNYLKRHINIYENTYLKKPYILFEKTTNYNDTFLIGDKAIKHVSGFRNDGSYFYGEKFIVPIEEHNDYNFKNTFDRIEKGDRRFEYGEEIDFEQLILIKNLLEYCQNKDLVVYGIFPPFAPSVIQKMQSNKYDYSYIKKASNKLKQLFNKFNYTFLDLTSYDRFEDHYYLDGFHCNRNVYFQLLKELKIPIDQTFDNHFNVNKTELLVTKKYIKGY